MFGQISATPPIDELRARRGARPEPTPRGIPDRVGSVSDLLAEPPGMDSDAATEQPLSVPASVASSPVPRGRRAGPALPIGILLYLASVGIVATATVGVLFGIGFSLLQPPDVVNAGAGTRSHGSEVELLLSSIVSRFFGDIAPADSKVVPVPIRPEVPRSAAVAALPAVPAAQPLPPRRTSPTERSGAAPPSAVGSAYASESGDAPTGEEAKQPAAPGAANDAAAPVLPAADPPSSSAVPVATAVPPGPDLPTLDIAEFLARGDSYLLIGDVTSARLFYERAADAGSGPGAMRLGVTFDPNFLGRAGLVGTRGDQAKADTWYRRARSLGAAEAARELKGRETK
jgi:hypothetical protein